MAGVAAGFGLGDSMFGVNYGGPTLPPVQQVAPIKAIYSPTQATDQKTVYNPMSTSHNYLQRFGLAKHF